MRLKDFQSMEWSYLGSVHIGYGEIDYSQILLYLRGLDCQKGNKCVDIMEEATEYILSRSESHCRDLVELEFGCRECTVTNAPYRHIFDEKSYQELKDDFNRTMGEIKDEYERRIALDS